ncbi:MAG: hypothetical protein FWG63_00595 [Defluviitaleaceae bacterium]|nr:hypothetical protein [Defluviitaleaceae bacterium]
MISIPIKNVYHMLVYAFKELKSKQYERLNRDDCENIYDLLTALLLCATQMLIKRGFLKSYVEQSDEIATLRGKINIGNSIRKLSFQNARAVCDFDEFSSNIYFNQVLKATLLYLKNKPLQGNIKRDVCATLMYFGEIDTISISSIKWDVLRAFNRNRNNAHYDTPLYFAALICEEAIPGQNKGDRDFRTLEEKFLPSLFERFIYAFYKKHLESCKVSFQQPIKWNANNADGMLPGMILDTVILDGGLKLIIDTKFYSKTLQSNENNKLTIRSNHLYQIFAYVKNEAAQTADKEVRGMLLYPKVDIGLENSYTIAGNHFYVQTVDLNQDFDSIKLELLAIYENVTAGS